MVASSCGVFNLGSLPYTASRIDGIVNLVELSVDYTFQGAQCSSNFIQIIVPDSPETPYQRIVTPI